MKINNVSKKSKILTSTWAIKKKLNCNFLDGINCCGYEQADGIHYDIS